MAYIEMSRDEAHGGEGWGFKECLWSPTVKKGNQTRWAYWTKVLNVRKDEIVLHLRGVQPNAYFVGSSVAASDGYETSQRPSLSGEWDYAETFYRADLHNYESFDEPVNLTTLFRNQKELLEAFFLENKRKSGTKLNLFYVYQSKQLRCQNGAYLSDLNDDLMRVLFGSSVDLGGIGKWKCIADVKTGEQMSMLRRRIGQQAFSQNIKKSYGNTCCFPGCEVGDERSLVGAHISRWSDSPELRGKADNGLCLCLFHDRAFEIGYFTLNRNLCVAVNESAVITSSLAKQLLISNGMQIKLAAIKPSFAALEDHWKRIKWKPT